MKFTSTHFKCFLGVVSMSCAQSSGVVGCSGDCGQRKDGQADLLRQTHSEVGNGNIGLSTTNRHLRALGSDKQLVCHNAGNGQFHTVDVATQAAVQHLKNHPKDLEGSCFGQCPMACDHKPCLNDFISEIREKDGRASCYCKPDGPSLCRPHEVCMDDKCVEMPSSAPSDIPSFAPSEGPSGVPTAQPAGPTCGTRCWDQIGQNIDGEVAEEDSGRAVALSSDGKTVAIGARHFGRIGAYSLGRVRVYRLQDGTSRWIQLVDIEGTPGDQLGASVAISSDGNTVAIGAPNNGSGHMKVFRFNNIVKSWLQLGDTIHGAQNGDEFGCSVSMSSDGKIVAIGARENDKSGPAAGHVRVYKFDGSTAWSKLGSDIEGEAASDLSGTSLALSGNGYILAIGAPFNVGVGLFHSGHVRVYSFNDSSEDWVQLGGDLDGEVALDSFGQRISLSSDGYTLAVGVNDSVGYVRVFTYNASSWSQLGGNIDGYQAFGFFGSSVDLSSDGRTLAIGSATADTGPDDNAGSARVYYFNNITTAWEPRGTEIFGEATYGYFGYALSMSADGSTLAVGAPFVSGKAWSTGQVRIFNWRP